MEQISSKNGKLIQLSTKNLPYSVCITQLSGEGTARKFMIDNIRRICGVDDPMEWGRPISFEQLMRFLTINYGIFDWEKSDIEPELLTEIMATMTVDAL